MRNGQVERELKMNQQGTDSVISAEIIVHNSFEFNLTILTFTFQLITILANPWRFIS